MQFVFLVRFLFVHYVPSDSFWLYVDKLFSPSLKTSVWLPGGLLGENTRCEYSMKVGLKDAMTLV